MSTNNLLTVSQVIQIPPGDDEHAAWINPGVIGICRRVERKTTKAGKPYWPCVIGDEHSDASVEVSFWSAPKFQEGDRVEMSGKGLRRTEYNGKAQVAVGKETVINVAAGAPRVMAAAAGAVAEKANNALISGQTVGMAVKEALAIVAPLFAGKLNDAAMWAQVHRTASDIIRVAQVLERGTLALSVRERSGQRGEPQPINHQTQESDFDEQDAPPF